jgi:RHS repeat-associated protein
MAPGAPPTLAKNRVWGFRASGPPSRPGKRPHLAPVSNWGRPTFTAKSCRTELFYLRARYYDPSTAQFVARDPAVSSTREPYAYAGDTPLDASDPSGMCWGPSWACGAENAAGNAAKAVGKAATNTATWVKNHPTQTALIVLGVTAIVVGTVITLGVGDAVIATIAAAMESGEVIDGLALASKFAMIVGPGIGSIVGGGYLTYLGIHGNNSKGTLTAGNAWQGSALAAAWQGSPEMGGC